VFEVIKKFHSARAGVLKTPHGEIPTPVFMPVGTQGTLKGVPHFLVDCPVILSNTYYLYLKPGVEIIKKFGGLHRFINWENSILTDSGGFQIFSLSSLFKIHDGGVEFKSIYDGSTHFLTPKDVIDIEFALGSDIIMPLDICLPWPQPKAVQKNATIQTIKWAEESIRHFKEKNSKQKLFAIIQGGTEQDLRKFCIESLRKLPFDGFAIGGLAVGEPLSIRLEILKTCLDEIDENAPRYVMGMGPPDELWEAVELGADMFDCVMPTRNGRNAQAFTFTGKLNLRNSKFKQDEKPLDENCPCPCCQRYSRAYIHHLFNVGEMLAQILTSLHNINFMLSLMNLMRSSILNGTFQEEKKKFLERWRQNDS